LREKFFQQRGEKGPGGCGDAGKSLRSARFQSPGKRLRDGIFFEVSEQVARRLCWQVLRQAPTPSQRKAMPSSDTQTGGLHVWI
jgi:hypothetical protein